MKITFVLMSAYGMGGTIRTVVGLANQLTAAGHRVELITMVRSRRTPFFELDRRIKVRTITNRRALRRRKGVRWALIRWAARRPSLLMNYGDHAYAAASLWSDARLLWALRRLDSDVLVTTRPMLNLFAARFAPRRLVRIAQEHAFVGTRPPRVQRHMRRLYPRLDAVVTLTTAHDEDLTRLLGDGAVEQRVIPNSIQVAERPLSQQENPLVVVAGRLAPIKQYAHLVRAFARVVEVRPEWKLRIYGAGQCRRDLRRLVHELRLYNHVFLMGRSNTVDREYAKASLTALSSSFEGLPMTLIEAMAAGVPPVSYDCPHGPREVVTHEVDGLLVPTGDVDALADGLLRLIEDDQLRRSMSEAARRSAMRFDAGTVRDEWTDLLEELLRRRGTTAPVRAAVAEGRAP